MEHNPALWTAALVSLLVLPWASWAFWKESRDHTLRVTYGFGFWVARMVLEVALMVTSGWFLWLAAVRMFGAQI